MKAGERVNCFCWIIVGALLTAGLPLFATGIDAPDLFDSVNREIWGDFVLVGGVLMAAGLGVLFINLVIGGMCHVEHGKDSAGHRG